MVGQVKTGQNSLFYILTIRMVTRNLDKGLYRYSIINITLFPLCSSHNNVAFLPMSSIILICYCFSIPVFFQLIVQVAMQDPGHGTKICDTSFFFYLICPYYYFLVQKFFAI